MPRQNTIQLRKGTLDQWNSKNTEVLASGEPGFETDTLRLKIGNGTTAWSGLNYVGLAGTGASGYLPKFTGSQTVTDSLIFDDGTRVGIGTTTPSGQLHVLSTGIGAMIGSYNQWTNGGKLRVYADDNDSQAQSIKSFISRTGVGLNIAVNATSYTIPPDNGSGTNIGLYGYAANGSGNYGLYVDSGYGYFYSRVGIGTTSPTADLHVNGSGLFSNNITASGFIKSGGTSSQFLKADGSVDSTTYLYSDNTIVRTTGDQFIAGDKKFRGSNYGISVGDDHTVIKLADNMGPGGSGIGLFDTNAPLAAQYWQATTDIIHYAYGGGTLASPRIAILESNGNVGIGTSSPSAKLHVNGSINVSNGTINVNDNSAYGAVLYSSGLKLFNNTIDVEVTQVDNNLGGYDFTPSGFLTANGRTVMGGGGPEIFSNLPEDGDIVLFSNFENPINNGIYRLDHIPDIDPEYPQYVFKGVRATSYTNGTSIPNGYRVKIAEINTSARFVLNRYDNGNSIIGTNSLVFEYDAGEAVMTIQNSLDVDFIAAISAKEKYFKIKHPDPNSKYSSLQYGSLESPYHGVRLTGKDRINNGVCEVYLPDYLKHLIHEEDVSIQLTNHGHHKILYVDKIDLKNNKFIVKGYRSKSGGPFNFYWSFTGIRKDVSILIPEQ